MLMFMSPPSGEKKINQVLQYIKSSQVTFIYIALYTILIVSKQLYRVKQENSLSIMQEDNNKSFFQLKSVHWWFNVDIIQFSSLPNNVCAISQASPNKQAKGDSGKDLKLHRWQRSSRKPWEKPGTVGGWGGVGAQFSSGQTKPAWHGLILGCNTGQIEQRTFLVLVVLSRWPMRSSEGICLWSSSSWHGLRWHSGRRGHL